MYIEYLGQVIFILHVYNTSGQNQLMGPNNNSKQYIIGTKTLKVMFRKVHRWKAIKFVQYKHCYFLLFAYRVIILYGTRLRLFTNYNVILNKTDDIYLHTSHRYIHHKTYFKTLFPRK